MAFPQQVLVHAIAARHIVQLPFPKENIDTLKQKEPEPPADLPAANNTLEINDLWTNSACGRARLADPRTGAQKFDARGLALRNSGRDLQAMADGKERWGKIGRRANMKAE
jgi:hypothetical protein